MEFDIKINLPKRFKKEEKRRIENTLTADRNWNPILRFVRRRYLIRGICYGAISICILILFVIYLGTYWGKI